MPKFMKQLQILSQPPPCTMACRRRFRNARRQTRSTHAIFAYVFAAANSAKGIARNHNNTGWEKLGAKFELPRTPWTKTIPMMNHYLPPPPSLASICNANQQMNAVIYGSILRTRPSVRWPAHSSVLLARARALYVGFQNGP